MKILYIANGNGLNPGMGGSLKRTIEMARRLKKMGCEIHFLTTSGGYKACQNEKLDVDYNLLPASIFEKKEAGIFDRILAYIISTIVAFWKVPQLPKCDLVYTDSDYFCDIIPAVLYKKIKDVPWIPMIHHRIKITKKKLRDFLITSISSIGQSFSFFLFKKYADKIFVYKSDMGISIARDLNSNGFPLSKIEMVTNGIDLKFIDSIQREKDVYDACFVGGIRPSKGIYDIVPIWKEVTKRKSDATLIIVGGGLKEYEDELRMQIQNENLESQIKMVGDKRHEEVIKIMKKSKIFISPSHEEGWGIAVCEAMSCKLPVIAYDLPVYKDVFGDTIQKIPLGNTSKFAEEIIKFINDKNLRINIGLKGYPIASRYDWDLVAKKEFKIFNDVLSGYVDD